MALQAAASLPVCQQCATSSSLSFTGWKLILPSQNMAATAVELWPSMSTVFSTPWRALKSRAAPKAINASQPSASSAQSYHTNVNDTAKASDGGAHIAEMADCLTGVPIRALRDAPASQVYRAAPSISGVMSLGMHTSSLYGFSQLEHPSANQIQSPVHLFDGVALLLSISPSVLVTPDGSLPLSPLPCDLNSPYRPSKSTKEGLSSVVVSLGIILPLRNGLRIKTLGALRINMSFITH